MNFLFIILGRNALVIFDISFISFSTKATSAFFNKKSELKKDFNDKYKLSFDNSISLFFISTLGVFNFTARLNFFGSK